MSTPQQAATFSSASLERFLELVNSQAQVHERHVRGFGFWWWASLLVGISGTALLFLLGSRIGNYPQLMNLGPALLLTPIASYQRTSMLASSKALNSYLFWKGEIETAIA